jgi:hypothetical protein
MYKKKRFLIGVILCGLLCGGCTTYKWGNYEDKLLAHYKTPDVAKLQASLESLAKDAERCKKVPPGLYAEVGYLLYEMDKNDRAIEYFEKEKTLWPESQFVMDKMIRNARNGSKKQVL